MAICRSSLWLPVALLLALSPAARGACPFNLNAQMMIQQRYQAQFFMRQRMMQVRIPPRMMAPRMPMPMAMPRPMPMPMPMRRPVPPQMPNFQMQRMIAMQRMTAMQRMAQMRPRFNLAMQRRPMPFPGMPVPNFQMQMRMQMQRTAYLRRMMAQRLMVRPPMARPPIAFRPPPFPRPMPFLARPPVFRPQPRLANIPALQLAMRMRAITQVRINLQGRCGGCHCPHAGARQPMLAFRPAVNPLLPALVTRQRQLNLLRIALTRKVLLERALVTQKLRMLPRPGLPALAPAPALRRPGRSVEKVVALRPPKLPPLVHKPDHKLSALPPPALMTRHRADPPAAQKPADPAPHAPASGKPIAPHPPLPPLTGGVARLLPLLPEAERPLTAGPAMEPEPVPLLVEDLFEAPALPPLPSRLGFTPPPPPVIVVEVVPEVPPLAEAVLAPPPLPPLPDPRDPQRRPSF